MNGNIHKYTVLCNKLCKCVSETWDQYISNTLRSQAASHQKIQANDQQQVPIKLGDTSWTKATIKTAKRAGALQVPHLVAAGGLGWAHVYLL